MNEYGRIAVCGSISAYNSDPANLPKCTIIQAAIVAKQLTMQGFLVARWNDRKFEGFEYLYSLLRNGKLRYKETITAGFENMFEAFLGMLRGNNFGKSIVKV